MPKPKKIYIGIDPDIDKNGIAIWDKRDKRLVLVEALTFWNCITIIGAYNEKHEHKLVKLMVIIEAGWLKKKSNWHGKHGYIAQRIAKNVGMNHAVGMLFEQYCKHKNIPYALPLPKGKVDAKLFKTLTRWEGRTNSEKRDAAMLVFGL